MATFDERFILPTQLPELQDNRLFNDFQVTPGTKIGNILTGNNGEERFQTWPERMVRSGLALPADVYSGREPIVDDSGHTAQPVIERAMDTAGLAGMSTIGVKPGTASVGSGLIAREDSKPATALAALKLKSEQFGLTEAEYLKQLPNNEQLKIFDELDARNAKLSPTEKMHYDYLEGKLGELEAGGLPKELGSPIKLDNGVTLVPVRHNPFAELEAGIAETVRGLPRERRTNPNITEDVPRQEIDKIHNIALGFVDKWNPKAREKRAEAQGFEQDAYHGAKDEWHSLNVKAPQDYGFYSTANPELANMYAGNVTDWSRKNVIPLKINTKEYNVIDAGGKSWMTVNDSAIAKAQKEGKKGIVIHNVYDEPSSGKELGAPKTVFISLDPTTVKSKFAKFNLEKLGLNDLLASGAGLLLGESMLDGAKKKEPKLIPVQGNPFQ